MEEMPVRGAPQGTKTHDFIDLVCSFDALFVFINKRRNRLCGTA